MLLNTSKQYLVMRRVFARRGVMWGQQQQCHGVRCRPLPSLNTYAHAHVDRGGWGIADAEAPGEQPMFVRGAMARCVVERPRLYVSATMFVGASVCDALCCHLHQARDLSMGNRVQSDRRRAAAHDLVGHLATTFSTLRGPMGRPNLVMKISG